MTDGESEGHDGDSDELAALRRRVERLERRYARERAAREEAEQIAESGLRELWKSNRLLEERVAERTAELESTLAATVVAATAKERFLAELGHELNTPLHNVLGLLELIEPGRLADDDRRRIDEVRRHAVELAGLLQGLVELAGAEGAPNPSDVAAAEPSIWLDELVATWSRPAAGRAQLLLPRADGPVGAIDLDWKRLRRAADAVLSNVIAHAQPGAVELTLSTELERVRLTVVDPGPGIGDELLGSVVEPFVSGGEHAGIGVGLTVADRLLIAAGGSLAVEVLDGRTSVELTLQRP